MKHSFSILLILCVLLVVGAAFVSQLDISDKPRQEQGKTLTISYKWKNASAKVVEQNVTSRIEAMVSSVHGVEKVSSVSRFGSGQVVVMLKPNTDVSAMKFEIASTIRLVRNKLPEGVSYPMVSGGEVNTTLGDDNEVKLVLTYIVNANMSGEQMRSIIEKETKRAVERLEGVHHVDVTGTTAHYMEIEYDAEQLAIYGIGSSDIIDAIRNYAGREDVIGEISVDSGKRVIPLVLSSKEELKRFEQMPLKNIDGKTIYLNNLASCNLRERKPDSYYRVNGMNTVYVNVYADKNADIVKVAKSVKSVMKLSPAKLHVSLLYDRAEKQMKEFRTLVMQSSLTLAILLLMVWLCSGLNCRYLAVIGVSLLADILVAVIFYRMFNLRLHPLSLAGIIVSLGIVIDSAIVMTDHYVYCRDRRVFVGIIAAMLTTVGSIVIVFWLPEHLRLDLKDFSVVIMINLLVAIAVTWFFIPALVSQFGVVRNKVVNHRSIHTRFVMCFSRYYSLYVSAVQRCWLRCVLLLVFACLFACSLKQFIDCLDTNMYRPKDMEVKLYIRAKMPLGGSVHELNSKVREVENFLSHFKKIKRYETSVRAQGASIVVEFDEEVQKSSFPYILENRMIGKLITIGGADWATYGVSERGFSNSLNLQYRANSIEIVGYDYERLYRFAEDLMCEMRKNSRVVDLAVVTPGHEDQEDELFMDYDRCMLVVDSVKAYDIYGSLQSMLADREAEKMVVGGKILDVLVHPKTIDSFDLWQLKNSYINADSRNVRPSGYMDIGRRKAKNIIPRENQEYVLAVVFNVLGSYIYTTNYIESVIDKFNASLPVGFRCQDKTYGAKKDDATQYWLIGLVAVIIFFILAVLFESLLLSLAITMLIPVSFIGLFVTYYVTGVPFGSGGFAAMVLLSGLTVNSGIYIVCYYNLRKMYGVHGFVQAFNHKIVPVMLTVLSTVLGMVPFILDGPDEQPFWFSLAVGTIGGLAFSVLPIVLFMPVVMKLGR